MAAIGLPSTRSSATKKSNSDDQAEWARRTEEAAWSAAHEAKAARRTGLVKCSRRSTPAPSVSMRRATPSTSAR